MNLSLEYVVSCKRELYVVEFIIKQNYLEEEYVYGNWRRSEMDLVESPGYKRDKTIG